MSVLIGQTDASGSVELKCPLGSRLRVLSTFTQLSGLSAGDQLVLSYLRSGGAIAVVFSQGMPATVQQWSCFIGAGQTEAQATVITPATGVVVFDPAFGLAQSPLPDIWWPWDIVLTVAAPTVGAMIVVYELTHLGKQNLPVG